MQHFKIKQPKGRKPLKPKPMTAEQLEAYIQAHKMPQKDLDPMQNQLKGLKAAERRRILKEFVQKKIADGATARILLANGRLLKCTDNWPTNGWHIWHVQKQNKTGRWLGHAMQFGKVRTFFIDEKKMTGGRKKKAE